MRKFSSKPILSFVGLAALLAGACSSSNTKSDGGTTGAGGGAGFVGVPLVPSDTGFVSDVTSMVIGAWYAYGDSAGPAASATGTDFADSQCAIGGFTMAQCSQIVAPTPGQPFAPTAGKGMCTNGTAAQVAMNAAGAADYSHLFGAGIGLDFNNPGAEGGPKGSFDVTPYKGIGFDFTGDVIPTGKMRVNFPYVGEHGTDSPYWDGANMASSPLTNGLHVEIPWAQVGGPMYLSGQTPPVPIPPFDATAQTHVESIQFQVFTNTTAATPYSFCVNNLTLLTQIP
jgi:hypothetical protein